MKNLLKKAGIIAALAAFGLMGCFSTDDAIAPKPMVRVDTVFVNKPDTTRPPINKPDTVPIVINKPDTGIKNPVVIKQGGWDDFPNKYMPTLKELSMKMTKLPMPMGIRYNSAIGDKPLSKVAAADTCPDGPREIFGLNIPARGLYVIDTIRYYNLAGEVGCKWHTLNTARVTHNRYILDISSGEAWEELIDSVSEQVVLPRHSISGTGRIRLNSRLEFAIQNYRVDMLTPYGEPGAIVTGGALKLGWKDGWTFNMEIVKPSPFKVDDYYPARDPAPATEKILSGPIRHDTTTVGYIDLHSDHTVVIRDWTGKPVTWP